MVYFIQSFLSICLILALMGASLWVMYFVALVLMWAFPFVAPVVLGALSVLAIIAWRDTRGY